MSEAGFSPLVCLTNSISIIVLTIVWSWIFNLARGSVWFAVLTHATSTASTGFAVALVGVTVFKARAGPIMFGTVALLVVLLSRGRLAYNPDQAPDAPRLGT